MHPGEVGGEEGRILRRGGERGGNIQGWVRLNVTLRDSLGRRGASIPLGLLRELPLSQAVCCLLSANAGIGASCIGLSPAARLNLLPAACCLSGTNAGTGASFQNLLLAARLDLLPIPSVASAAEGLLAGLLAGICPGDTAGMLLLPKRRACMPCTAATAD